MPYPTFNLRPDDVGFSMTRKTPIRTSVLPSSTASATQQAVPAYFATPPPTPSPSTRRQVSPEPTISHRSARKINQVSTTAVKQEEVDVVEDSDTDSMSSGGASEYCPALETLDMDVKPSSFTSWTSDSDSDDPKTKRRLAPASKTKRRRSTSTATSATPSSPIKGHSAKRHKLNDGGTSRGDSAALPAIHNAPYTGEDNWALFCVLYPMASRPDYSLAMASTGRDKVSLKNRSAILKKRVPEMIKAISGKL